MKETVWSGEKISAAGVYKDIPIRRYHEMIDGNYTPLCNGTSISSTGLRQIFSASPAHYWDGAPLNPNRTDDAEESSAFVMGRAVHHLFLGEPKFGLEFTERPESLNGKPWQGNRLDCRAWLAAKAEAGITVLTGKDLANIKGMAVSVGMHPLVSAGILRGRVERSMIFRDRETAIWVRVRPDAIPTESGDFFDLKTSASVVDYGADKSISRFRYDIQGALVRWACRELGIPFNSFTLVFVETKTPWCVDVLTLTDKDLDEGERDARTALRTFAHCLKTNNWFGPAGTQNDARMALISEGFRKGTKSRREHLEREIGVTA